MQTTSSQSDTPSSADSTLPKTSKQSPRRKIAKSGTNSLRLRPVSLKAPAPKSEAKLKKKPRAWSRKKTLARKVEYRPIELEDMPYVWAAYKQGALASMGGDFADPEALEPEPFREAFVEEVMTYYHGAWTLFAETPKQGMVPIGAVLAFWTHPMPERAPFMIVGDMIWFPWSSSRNRIEASVNFFHHIRRQVPMVMYANAEVRKFWEVLCKHGIVNRVGTTYSVYPDKPATIFETRRVEH